MEEYIFNTSFYFADYDHKEWEEWLKSEMFTAAYKLLPDLKPETFHIISASQGGNNIYSVQWRCKEILQVNILDECMANSIISLKRLKGERINHFSTVLKKME